MSGSPSRRLAAALAIATGVVSTLVTAGSVPTADAALPAEPGAAGIGDRYFPTDGNGGYQVEHYDIADTYRFDIGRISGSTDIRAVATQRLSRFNLDLVLRPLSVSVNGSTAEFSSNGHELRVTPGAPIADGAEFTVRVRYRGRPGSIERGGERPWIASRREVIAINEPHIAPWWFAANDHPRDKATFDIRIRVPRGKQVVSNGEQVGQAQVDGDWATWHWQMNQPMTTYLAFFAAGRFLVERGDNDGLPYTLAVSRRFGAEVTEQNMQLLRRTPGIVAWLASQYGEYPFASTGGLMTSLYTGFALENASRPTYPYLGGGRAARNVVVHELAHQWFGDDVSVDRWRDVWLNEGFATYVEWRYAETHDGTSAQQRLIGQYRSRPAGSSFWDLEIGNPGPKHLFDWPVYQRGAMTLQALRHRIGASDFDTLMRTWVDRHGGGNARTPQLRRLAERVSGRQLDGFFRAWLFTGAKPARTRANGLR
jgi:aminopeptidase N